MAFTITPAEIQPGTQTLTLAGSGTAWSADTMWSITLGGTAALSASTIVVTSPTAATWTVTVSGTGTLTISDGATSSLVVVAFVGSRAQFRDTLLLRSSNGVVMVPREGSASVYDVGTSTPIADVLYADVEGDATLVNPVPVSSDGSIVFWLTHERVFDLVVSVPGYAVARVTTQSDSVKE